MPDNSITNPPQPQSPPTPSTPPPFPQNVVTTVTGTITGISTYVQNLGASANQSLQNATAAINNFMGPASNDGTANDWLSRIEEGTKKLDEETARLDQSYEKAKREIEDELELLGDGEGIFGTTLLEFADTLNKFLPPLGLDAEEANKLREKEIEIIKKKYEKDKSAYEARIRAAQSRGLIPGTTEWNNIVGTQPIDIFDPKTNPQLENTIREILASEQSFNQRYKDWQERVTAAKKDGLKPTDLSWNDRVGPEPQMYGNISNTITPDQLAQGLQQLGSRPLTYEEAAKKIGLGFLTTDEDLFGDLGNLLNNLGDDGSFLDETAESLKELQKKIEAAIKNKMKAFDQALRRAHRILKDRLSSYLKNIMVKIQEWIAVQLPDMIRSSQFVKLLKKIYNDLKVIKKIVEIILVRTKEYIFFVEYIATNSIKKLQKTLERVAGTVQDIEESVDRYMKIFGDEISTAIESAKALTNIIKNIEKELMGLVDEYKQKFKKAALSVF